MPLVLPLLSDLPSDKNPELPLDQPAKDTGSHAPYYPAVLPAANPHLPPWCLTPLVDDRHSVLNIHLSPWPGQQQLIASSPDIDVVSPVDILFGSKHNAFTTCIQRSLPRWPCRAPERLAVAWLIYAFSKWRAEPTAERYLRLPAYIRPVTEQILLPHLSYLDLIVWERLRTNLIRKYRDYEHDIEGVFGTLLRCLRVRWPWGEDFLEPGDDGGLRMSPQFFDMFTRVEGWGLTEEFVQTYPALVEGLDLDVIMYEEVGETRGT
jgi:hypothetical protein